jgi:hypothetical protein
MGCCIAIIALVFDGNIGQEKETTSHVDRTLWPGFKPWREDDSAFWVAPGDDSKSKWSALDRQLS